MQYSKAPASVQVAAKLTEALPQPAQNAWTDIKDFAARKMPYVMTTFQIFEQFGSKLKRLGDMIRANDLMRQESTALQMKVDDIVKRWDKPEGSRRSAVAGGAARHACWCPPDKAWAHRNAHVPRAIAAGRQRTAPAVRPAQGHEPRGRENVPRRSGGVRGSASTAGEGHRAHVRAVRQSDAQGEAGAGSVLPTGAPRDYLAIGESPQLVALKKQLETLAGTEGNDEAIADLNSRIDQLEADGQHFWVSAHEHRSGMENALREYESRGLVGRRSMADQRLGALPTRNLHSTIAAPTAEATKNLSKDGARRVGNALPRSSCARCLRARARTGSRAQRCGWRDGGHEARGGRCRPPECVLHRTPQPRQEVADAARDGPRRQGDINRSTCTTELEQRHRAEHAVATRPGRTPSARQRGPGSWVHRPRSWRSTPPSPGWCRLR